MKALRWLLLIIVLALVALAVTLLVMIRRPFPQTSGTIKLVGLQETVEVKRDALGVPHIYAQNDHDLMFAQGYVHAQDRFWQMEFWRHTSAGRLSEIVGPATLETDKFIRNMGWNRMAERSVAFYQAEMPEVYRLLEAYAAGVNAYIAEQSDAMSFNQSVLNLSAGEWKIEPWEPKDTIGWGIVMAWDLRGSGNFGVEILLAELRDELGDEVIDALIVPYLDDRPVIVPPPYDDVSSAEFQTANDLAIDWDNINLIGSLPEWGAALGDGATVGSNNWVVAGEHTVTGEPLLADDPHLGVQMPSIWYMVGLHAPGWDVAGMSFAGIPGVIIGHNNDIGWGVTNMSADTQDTYIERINPDNPRQYEFMGEWRDMTVIEEVIHVNGGESVTLEVLETHHGPILNTVDDELEQVLSVRWAAAEPSAIFAAVVQMNRATNYEEFRAALSNWHTSGQNFVYADKAGNIAYQSTGRYPVREGWLGREPVPGWTGDYEWQGFIPYDDMPRRLNPDEGYIVTANNAIVDETYPYFLAHDWATGDRAQRINDLLSAAVAQGTVSAETYATIHFDSYDLMFDRYRPLLTALSSDDADVQAAIERVRGWDGQLRRDSVPATIFEVFLWQLAEAMLRDELGESGDSLIRNSATMRRALHTAAGNKTYPFWDDVSTSAAESAEEIMLRAFEATVAWLQENHGSDMQAWTWGSIHTITLSSNPLGQSGIIPLERIVNSGPHAVDGGTNIVNANGFSWGEHFGRVRGNPSMRMIIDFADFDASLAVLPTGQSGHPFHRDYTSMVELWLNGAYHEFLFSDAAVDGATAETLILEPSQ